MGIYRGLAPLKAYKGDMQPVNVYKGSTKVAGWHSASYSGTSPLTVDCDYNVPPDALVIDGKCSQVQSCWGTNLVTNGDFSNGTTGWSGVCATLSASDNVAICKLTKLDTTHYNMGIYSTAELSNLEIYHKYYISINVDSNMAGTFAVQYGFSNQTIMTSALTKGIFTHLSQTIVLKNASDSLRCYFAYGSTVAIGEELYIKNVSCIDLTAAFGAGKEPTASQMDAIMAQFHNSWFDGSAQLSTDTTTYTPNSPSPSFPAPISTITSNVGITGADGAASDTATVAFGSAVCASLPDGTHDSYDAVTGVLNKRVGKFIGSSGTSWTLSDAETDGAFMCDKIPAGNLSGQTLSASSACAPTIYYKLATQTTVQLTPHIPVVRTGIKTLSVGADVVPTISATVKSMD
jgi:hypothetical protein